MSVSVSTFAWLFFISLTLFLAGRYLKDYTVGTLGGFALFLLGVYILIEGLVGVSSWFNTVIASTIFGVGIYIFIQGSFEAIRKGGG